MKNTLALILASLRETLESNHTQPQWGPGVQLVEERVPGVDGHVWWISASECPLGASDIALLADRQLLTNNGETVSKKFGRFSRKALGVKVRKLEVAAAARERALAGLQVEEETVRDLRRQLRVSREQVTSVSLMEDFLQDLRALLKVRPPEPSEKVTRVKRAPGRINAGVPTLLCSDWHVGEVVDPERVNYLNEYNEAIAHARIGRTFDTTLDVLLRHQAGMSYDGIVVALAGDMLSGNIHEDLRVTNERPVQESLLDLAEVLACNIVRVASEFPAVHVPAVSGNHGKAEGKSGAKLAQVENHDYLLYRVVELLVASKLGPRKNNVTFDIPKGSDTSFSLYGTRYLLTHGNQSNTSTNSDNFWPTMAKMAAQRQERLRGGNARAEVFDYLTVGHFHQYGTVNNVIVNGSLKGHCEWAYQNGFTFQAPIQALWTTHPEYGITSHVPIYGEEPDKAAKAARRSEPPIGTNQGMLRRK